MAAANHVEVTSPEHFKELLSADLNRVSVLNFWASWAEPCEDFNKVVEQEAKSFEKVLFLNVRLVPLSSYRWLASLMVQIEAEALADISESFDIEAVPSFLLLRVCRRPIHPPSLVTPHQEDQRGRVTLSYSAGSVPRRG